MGERIVDRWQIVVHQRWGIPLRALRCAACALASFGNRTRVHPHDSRRYPTTNGGLFEASSFSVSLSDALVSITFCGSLTADLRKWRLTHPRKKRKKRATLKNSPLLTSLAGSLVGHRHRRRESVSVDSAAMAKAASLATLASTPTLNLNDIKYVRDTDAANKMPPTPPKDLTSERNDAFLRTCKEMRNLGDAP